MSSKKEHEAYLQALKNLGPEKRLLKAFELSELTKELFKQGLKKRYPSLSDEEFRKLYLKEIDKCHNLNY